MTFNRREKILIVVVGLLLTLVAGRMIWQTVTGPVRSLRARRDGLIAEVAKKQERLDKAKPARAKLDDWNRRSLPSDPVVAQRLYQNWLLKQSESAGMKGTKVEISGGSSRRGVYRRQTCKLKGTATLEQLSKLLFDFYSAGHLHQISRLKVTPKDGAKTFDVELAIETLSLPGADRDTELSAETSDRLAISDVAEYQKVIGERNLFAAYVPPKPPEPPKQEVAEKPPEEPEPPSYEDLKWLYLTGIAEKDGRPQVWLVARKEDKQFRLFEGEQFELGDCQGTVIHIDARSAIFDLTHRRVEVALGKNFDDDARELPSPTPPQPLAIAEDPVE